MIDCRTPEEFQAKIEKYQPFNLSVVCHKNELSVLTPFLVNVYLQKLYVLTEQNDQVQPGPLSENVNNIVSVFSENQLMRQLCSDVMIGYFQQGSRMKQSGNWGLANLYFADARDALKHAQTYI
jgi:hypothetical protein